LIEKISKILSFDLLLSISFVTDKDLLLGALQEKGFSFSKEKGKEQKLTFWTTDRFGKRWLIGSIVLKRQQERLEITGFFIDSLERIIALLLERGNGTIPFIFCPEQVRLLPLKKEVIPYAREIQEALKQRGIASFLSIEEEVLGKRIAEALRERIPYCIVVGESEMRNREVAFRNRDSEQRMPLVDFLKKVESLNAWNRY
jgi:threonyl-tRNA synthetase